ncbi:phosphorylcholine transferase LicD [uncultured Acetatifactor sp.]|jgi:lipopolysaccharide cholinephosphotransferase|uniref:LicD family protein n=1 Tax=uncultured Acetatifactor sp. TaxID=1671927 RepID=UPI002638CBE6|nr:LicD family protein [uncultured Acetatifactor sp.]
MRKLSLQEIKDLELKLLIQFAKICEVNNLYYTLCGGTLLGAIRHKGFIPWDDDIDVLMPRPDYDRLLNGENIILSSLPSHMQIIHWKNGTSNFPFIKLIDLRTRIDVDYFDSSLSCNKIWIDIFPIDGNPEDMRLLEKLYAKSLHARKLLCLKMAKSGEGKTQIRRIVKPFFVKILSTLNFKKICQKIDAISKTYSFEESKFIGGVLWGYGPQECINKEKFMQPVKVEFEKHFFNAPSNYDEYLTGLYKDYMKLPPNEERQVHGINGYIIDEG